MDMSNTTVIIGIRRYKDGCLLYSNIEEIPHNSKNKNNFLKKLKW